jgi:Flp pilus assembly protein TadG
MPRPELSAPGPAAARTAVLGTPTPWPQAANAVAPDGGRRPRRDRGAFAVELAIITPAILLVLSLIVSVGRVTVSAERVQTAARDGARAASINHAGTADNAARIAVASSLQANGVTCEGEPSVSVNPGDPTPGGVVTVTVACEVPMLVGLTVRVQRVATSPVDVFRGTD